jgi:hypothetical protein
MTTDALPLARTNIKKAINVERPGKIERVVSCIAADTPPRPIRFARGRDLSTNTLRHFFRKEKRFRSFASG